MDSTEAVFGFFGMAFVAAFVSWASLIVRAIRGEEVTEDWRTHVSTGAALAGFTLLSAARARDGATLRLAAVELRNLASEAAAEDVRRDERATKRVALDAERQDRLNGLTKLLVVLAVFTLASAMVTLVVTIIGG